MQHHRGGGEPPYGAPMPSMAAFSLPPPPPPHAATVPAPTASDVLLPPTQPQMAPVTAPGEFTPAAGSGSAAAVNFHEDDMMVLDVSGGAGGSGNRWPREETLALIRIRSEMDAAFRNAALKAPVWEELSRRLAELGYHRSGKKCKEKFENVDKYYKRTKEGRAGRQDGKSYRFFSQLEALHAAAPSQQQQKAVTVQDPRPLAIARMAPGAGGLGGQAGGGASLPDLSFLSMSSESESESDQEFDDDDDEEEEEVAGGRDGLGGFRSGDDVEGEGSRSRMMVLFEGMMRRVTEKQDAMQRAFLETLDRWETERTQREEAWRRKEVARMNRERELLSQERAAAASRDAALIEFLNRISGDQPVRLSPSTIAAMRATFPGPHHDAAAAAGLHLIPVPPKPKPEEGCAGGEGSGLTPSSRWPKEEVQALIEMRVEKEEQYSDMGPKGPLWEEIAAGMQRIGYNRSAKRCKEKWENINKYFKKVKESNKRRPEDSKTCPYFHQLDAIYRKKHFAGRGSGVATASGTSLAIVTVPGQESPSQRELEGKSRNDGMPQHGDNAVTADKKAEVTGTEPNVTPEETDSDDMEGNYTEGDDDDKMQYKIEFQKPNAIGGGSNTPSPATTAAATSSTRTPTSNTSFLAVQ